jgi:hemin uptake protein HemP
MSNLQSAPQSLESTAIKMASDAGAVPHLSSTRLLGAAGEAVIEHEGNFYRLRRTPRTHEVARLAYLRLPLIIILTILAAA